MADLLEYLSDLDLDAGVHILEATINSDRRIPLVRVVVDTERGITIDELVRIARQLRDEERLPMYLGVSDCRVEVTSPGVSHGLSQPWQFSRHVGRRLAIQIKTPNEELSDGAPLAEPMEEVGRSSQIEGQLMQAGTEGILLEVAGVHEQIPWIQIQKATVQLTW